MPFFSEIGGRAGELLESGGPFGDLPDEERIEAIRGALRSLGLRKAKVPPDLVKMLAAQGVGLGGIDRFIGDIQARQSLMDKSDKEVTPGTRERDVFPMQTLIPDDPRDAMQLDPARLLEIQNILLYGSPRGGTRSI
jgi:hypothetical protein